MEPLVRILVFTLVLVTGLAHSANEQQLEIYFIDVEGGQSTLVVAPDGESLLIDTGYAGNPPAPGPSADVNQARDANRILAAARDAGVRQIDYLLITHFHGDHAGGVPELAQLLPIRTFIDHGSVGAAEKDDPGTKAVFDAYAAVRRTGRHIEPKPGDRLPFKALDVTVVSSAAATLDKPLTGASGPNPACDPARRPAANLRENPRSTGVVVAFGRFRFLDLGDLSDRPLFDLACPADMVGPVDVYLVPHHGGADVAEPATFAAFKPRVVVMNNGATKGGALTTYEYLHHVAGLDDVWQLHRSEAAGDENFAAARIANPDESTAHWIKISANSDGSFKVMNARTGESVSYGAR